MRRIALAGGCLALLILAALAFAWSAASTASSSSARSHLTWDAAEKQSHLDEKCRESCRNRGTEPALCASLCSCTMEALFSSRSDEELRRLTAEGPYGRLSKETNELMGQFALQCAEAEKAARAKSAPPAS